MHFITCFDDRWMENLRRFNADSPGRAPDGRVLYEASAQRCFGYFATKERALAAVEANEGDLHECLYTFCLVEHLPPGIHCGLGEGVDTTWFQWQAEDAVVAGSTPAEAQPRWGRGRWVPIERPSETLHLLNFSIG